ncbi:MAG: transcription termination factor Rho [Actinobacteria bacterium]|nr:transcription termination factor Rho [Actinomycetota bacterium]
MSGEQQLERSVLDAKERDELRAIADAMGVKTTARVAKATLVSQILRAAGVEVDDNGASTRGRTPRAKATNGDAREDAAVQTDSGTPGDTTADAAPVAAETPAAATEAAPAPAGAPATEADPSDAAVPPAQADGGASGGGADSAPAEGEGRDPQQAQADARPEGRQQGGQGGQPQQRDGGGRQQQQQQQRDRDRNNRQGGGQFDGNADPGNRRNRRRRGRDRDRVPGGMVGERDLPGMGQETQFQGEPVPVSGLLDLRDEGFGFLRTKGYLSSQKDVYVSISQVRRFALRKGDHIEGASRPASSNEKYPALLRIDTVSGMTPDEARLRPRFEDLTPLFPDARLNLERPGDPANMTARIVDLLSPIGKGQRGLIVSPPKAGKTTVMKQIAHSIEANNPEVHLMVLLVDERPEEVTDMKRSVEGEVVASTFDRPSDEHTQVAELAIERAKRLVEVGKDVVIILDGITRLARAYNLAAPASGRILSGGVDSGALYPPKKFFGSARNIEEGGSLTILATALVETGSRMDEVIFEEFKGTGNMELRLDRKLAERRIYPAIDVNASSTRHEELLFDRSQLQQVWKLRRVLNALGSEGSAAAGLELLMDKIKTTKSNDEFLAEIAKGPTPQV